MRAGIPKWVPIFIRTDMIKRGGFTLVELMVTLGIFGVIMIAGSSFLIQTIRSSNQATIQNEVRQNASVILQDIIAQARRAYCVYYQSPSANIALLRVSDDPNGTNCASGNQTEYYQDQNGVVTRAATDSGNIQTGFGILTSAKAVVLDCSAGGVACGAASCTKGLLVSPSGLTNNGTPVTLTIRAQQLPGQSRSDFCAAVKLSDTITPRVK